MPNQRAYSLALFGQIDQEVIDADERSRNVDDAVLATVESLMPHSTALGQHGWYRELEKFLNAPTVREGSEPFAFPTFAEATEALSNLPRIDRTSIDAEPLDEDRQPALARAVYACVVLDKIRRVKNSFRVDDDPELTRDNVLWGILPPVLDGWPMPGGQILSGEQKAQALEDRIDEIVDQDSFVRVAGEEISPQFAERAKPCFGTLEDAGGEYCSTLYTDSEDDDLTVADIKTIIHPLNWDLCCPTFFHAMTEQTPGKFTAQGWNRIVESISAEPNEYLLRTALVFYLEERKDGLIINYQLDKNRSGEGKSAGIVEIDNGYIWVTPTHKGPGGKGIRIQTSKEERVNGLSPTATAALGCLLGWSDSGKEMLAGTARKAMNNKLPLPQGRSLKAWPSPTATQNPVDTETPVKLPAIPATLPINYPDTVKDVGALAKSLIDKVTANVGNAASRWLDGLIRDDVEDVTKQMGKDLKDWSLEVYDTAERNVRPPEGANNG